MRESRGRALFVAPEPPYPLIGGGAFRSASLLDYLAQYYSVDAIVFRPPDHTVAFPDGRVKLVDTIEMPRHSKQIAARMFRNSRRILRRSPPLIDRFGGFGAQMTALLHNRPAYDLAVIEHFWCAPYLEQIAPYARRTILDLHNIESAWHSGCGKVSPWPHSVGHAVFHRAALALEREWLPRFSLLLATSAEDAARIRKISPQSTVTVYPNTIPLINHPPRQEQNIVLFSGTLDYEPNGAAVRHFAANIWPALRAKWPGLRWRLVGRNPEAIERHIAGVSGVECTGLVDDAIPHLASAKVVVVPLLSGSGTRLKIIEAWAAAAPVVSTTLGAEGLPARHDDNILLADTAPDFIAAVSRLLASPADRDRIGNRGREQYERQCTWTAAWTALDRELEPLVKS